MTVVRHVFRSLYGSTSNSTHVDAQVAILVAIRDVCKLAVEEQLTSLLIYSDDKTEYNCYRVCDISSAGLSYPGIWGRCPLNVCSSFLRLQGTSLLIPLLCQVIWEDDYNNVESMTADPHGFHDQVSMLVNKWYRIYEATGTNDAAVTRFEQ
ncbi:hypothetical protein MKW92_009277 [Papaver armeniacum]|nr:hypothetical protein MKW92_009277 [Papaver armeniacum]